MSLLLTITLFWDHSGSLVEHYMSKGTTVTNASYCSFLGNHLRPAIRSKPHGLLSTDILLLHNNTRPHTAHVTAETIRDIHFERLPLLPYSPDFTHCEYHIFGPFKEALGLKTSDLVKKCKRQCICDSACN